MNLLLDDKWAPVTSEIGFLEIDSSVAAEAFLRWQQPIQAARGVTFRSESISGSLVNLLQRLLPLTSVERRRYLFIPTTSSWTAFFDNGYRGTDAVSTISFLAKELKCRGLRVVAIPDTIQKLSGQTRGRYGAVTLEVYGSDTTDYLNYIRSISVSHDGGRWVFDQGGTAFPFENVESYKARSTQQRFTFEMLQDYLKHLGLTPFDEDFYLPSSTQFTKFIEKRGPMAANLKEYTLTEVQATF